MNIRNAAAVAAVVVLGIAAVPAVLVFTGALDEPEIRLQDRLASELRLVPDAHEENYYAVVTRGKLKGQVAEASTALLMNRQQLRAVGVEAYRFYLRLCDRYADTPPKVSINFLKAMVQYCTQKPATKQQVIDYYSSLG